jgi:peptidoglycan/xylan/chitin deacetylase (PgdA/CDA1 family)/SAM-dependent methyltransferase
MEPRIGAVVRCGDLIGGVYPAVDSLIAGSKPAHVVAIVADLLTPERANSWLQAFATTRGFLFLRVGTTSPGACWNAGLRAIGPVDVALCLDAGEVLERSALERMTRCLSSDPGLAFVTSGIEWIGPGTHRTFTLPRGCAPLDILGDTLAVHGSSLFRWKLWEASSGFDEKMPALEHTDFWLRLLDGGGRAAVESAPLLRRRVHPRALYRRTWMTDDYGRAARILYERHCQRAGATPGALLKLKERIVVREHLRHQDSRARLQTAEHETKRLTQRRSDILADVPLGWSSALDLGSLARATPLSHDWGYERGTPADRPLIERHLAAHAADICGVVLEIQEDDYTKRFGGTRVERGDVLDVDITNPRATIIGDLRAVEHVRSETYDCIILTQTLHVIDDMPAVIRECERLLKPGGVLLATLPSASRVCLEYGPEADFWRVTDAGARQLFAGVFSAADVETTAFGNPLVNAAFGFGLASEDLPAGSYDTNDPYFPMVIGVRARKGRAAFDGNRVADRRGSTPHGVVLMYHRVGAEGVDPHRLSVSAATLRAQLDWLCSTCSVVPLEQIAEGGTNLPSRAVSMTFDDGYVDNLSVTLPLLRAAGVGATFFLTSGEGPFPYHYWWDRLAAALLGQAQVPSSLMIDLPSGGRELATSTEKQRLAAHWLIYHEVNRLPALTRDAIVDTVVQWAGMSGLGDRDRRLTWPEARELMSDSHSIGAHTVEHLFLPAQPDSVLKSELVDNRATLERLTGTRVESLAYPFGAMDERTVSAARDAGFRVAVTCRDGGITASDDPLALPRVEVTEGPLDGFIAKIERALKG